MRILFCKAKGPGPLSLTAGLGARILHSHHLDPASYNWGRLSCNRTGECTHSPGVEQSRSTPAHMTPDLRLHNLGELGRHGSQLPGEQIQGELSTPRPKAEREASEWTRCCWELRTLLGNSSWGHMIANTCRDLSRHSAGHLVSITWFNPCSSPTGSVLLQTVFSSPSPQPPADRPFWASCQSSHYVVTTEINIESSGSPRFSFPTCISGTTENILTSAGSRF